MFPEWTWILGLLLGATIGSFLNVVIYRLPRGISLSNPAHSFCPSCRHELGPLDLFPLFSWLVSGGKCRYCKNPVPVRYFLVEMLNGVLWAGVWWQYLIAKPDAPKAVIFALACAALVAIIFIDWELYIIPDELNASVLLIGLGYHFWVGNWQQGFYGALLGWGFMWGMALLGGILFRRSALGDGDIKMMRGVGLILGPLLLGATVGIAVILGIIGGVTGMVIASRTAKSATEESGTAPEGESEPLYIRDLFVLGAYYLLCLDVLAVPFKGVETAVTKLLIYNPPEEEIEDDESWKTPTTIPFGPYLAAGAIICMLFGGAVEAGLRNYWQNATGVQPASELRQSGRTHSAFVCVRAGFGARTNACKEGAMVGEIDGSFLRSDWNISLASRVNVCGESRADTV